jgi:hypothetical protein
LRLQRAQGETRREDASVRIEQLVYHALDNAGAEGWSSAWKIYEPLDEEAPQPPPPPSDASETAWRDYLNAIPAPHVTVRWQPLPWGDTLDRRFRPKGMGRAGRNGKPAYLVHAVLGALLDQSPETIMNALDNFRHRRRRQPKL